jgi:Tfp pilus assembly protein PilN
VRAVNLLPSEAQRRARSGPNQATLAAAIAGVVVVAILGGGNLFETARVAAAQRTLNDAKIQLAGTPLPPATAQVTPPPPAVAAEMAPRLQAVTTALSTRIAWDRVLREFSLVLPSDIQLTQLSLTQPVSAAAASTGLQLSGVTYSYDSVARLLSRMALIPDLTGVNLGPTSVTNRIVTFQVNATVKGAAPAAVVPTLPTTTTTGSSS